MLPPNDAGGCAKTPCLDAIQSQDTSAIGLFEKKKKIHTCTLAEDLVDSAPYRLHWHRSIPMRGKEKQRKSGAVVSLRRPFGVVP